MSDTTVLSKAGKTRGNPGDNCELFRRVSEILRENYSSKHDSCHVYIVVDVDLGLIDVCVWRTVHDDRRISGERLDNAIQHQPFMESDPIFSFRLDKEINIEDLRHLRNAIIQKKTPLCYFDVDIIPIMRNPEDNSEPDYVTKLGKMIDFLSELPVFYMFNVWKRDHNIVAKVLKKIPRTSRNLKTIVLTWKHGKDVTENVKSLVGTAEKHFGLNVNVMLYTPQKGSKISDSDMKNIFNSVMKNAQNSCGSLFVDGVQSGQKLDQRFQSNVCHICGRWKRPMGNRL